MSGEPTVSQPQRRIASLACAQASMIGLLTLGLFLSPCRLGAQAMESLVVGARIRVLARDTTKRIDGERQFTARFDGIEADSLTVSFSAGTDRVRLPLSALKSVDVSVSRRSAGHGALVGAGYGALLGATVTFVYLARVSGRSCDGCLFSKEAGVLINGVPLTILSSAIGAVIFSRRQDKWRRVPMESLLRRE